MTGTGRGRGRPPKITPPPTPNPVPSPADQWRGSSQPVNSGMMPPSAANLTGGSSASISTPSFTTDILSQLPPEKQPIMVGLVNRFKSKQLAIQDFMAQSKVLLGDKLYAILAQGMSSMVRVPLEGAMGRPPMPMTRQQPLGQDGNIFGPSDATQIDSAALQDVIQYSGIDLRAEAEMIESEFQMPYSQAPVGADSRIKADYFINFARFKAIICTAARQKGLNAVSEDAYDLIALALQRRLSGIICSLAQISKHRVDAPRASFKIKVENDPKKQLWILEKLMEEEEERSQTSMASGAPSGSDAEKGKGKKAAPTEKSRGEDVLVKTRLANTTALAALGVQQKSWMTAGIVGLQAAAAISKPAESGDDPSESTAEAVEPVKIPLHFSQAPSVTPTTDRELAAQLAQRRLTLRDLVFYCESDPHLVRSNILYTLYDLANF